jgi:hypothetical protein
MFKFRQLFITASVLFLLTMAFNVAAQSENHAYLPLTKADLGRPFALKPLGMIDPRPEFERQLNVGVSTATLKHTEDGDLLVTGKDRAGKPWSVLMGGMCGASGAGYEADLDRNGLRDLVLMVATCGCGLAPSSHIVTVTFERDGRPVRFEAEGYFDYDAKGVFDLRDMNSDGKAELIYTNFDDGYWITNIYTTSDARWRRVKGSFGKRDYPLYTRFTNRPNRRATRPKAGRNPFAPDLSNDAPYAHAQLRSFRWADVSQSEDVEMSFETSEGRMIKCQPVSWYASFTVVMDGEKGRNIFTLSGAEDNVKNSLGEIVAGHYDVTLYGQRDEKRCSPELLWVRMK